MQRLINRQFISVSRTLAANVPQSASITVPSGYNYLTGIYFDPTNTCFLSIWAEKAATNILKDFNLKLGFVSFINPKYYSAENDILQVTLLAPTNLGVSTVSFQFDSFLE